MGHVRYANGHDCGRQGKHRTNRRRGQGQPRCCASWNEDFTAFAASFWQGRHFPIADSIAFNERKTFGRRSGLPGNKPRPSLPSWFAAMRLVQPPSPPASPVTANKAMIPCTVRCSPPPRSPPAWRSRSSGRWPAASRSPRCRAPRSDHGHLSRGRRDLQVGAAAPIKTRCASRANGSRRALVRYPSHPSRADFAQKWTGTVTRLKCLDAGKLLSWGRI